MISLGHLRGELLGRRPTARAVGEVSAATHGDVLPASVRRADLWVHAALVAAIILRLARLDEAPFWIDEVDSAQWIGLPWSQMLHTVVSDNHLPLYFVILKAWSTVAGSSPWALRLPSVLLSCAMVPLTAAVAGTLIGRRAQRWAAWLTALSPYLVHHAQEARMYALVGALAAVQLLLLARFVTGASRSLGWTFVVTAAALVWSHYYCVFFVAGELLALSIVAPRASRAWLPAAMAICLLLVSALLVAALIARHTGGGLYRMGWYALPGVLWSMLSGYTLLPSSEELHFQGTRSVLPYLPIALPMAIPFLASAGAAVRSIDRSARVVLLTTLAAALIGPFAVRMVLGAPANPRYFMAGAPALIVLLAAGAPATLGTSPRSLATIALTLTMAAGLALHLRQPGYGREDMRAAGEWLDAHVPVDEEILVTSNEMAHLARFHWPARSLRLYPDSQTVAGPENAGRLAERLPFAGPRRAIYVVGRAWVSDPAGALQHALAERYAACPGTEVRGVRILCLQQP